MNFIDDDRARLTVLAYAGGTSQVMRRMLLFSNWKRSDARRILG
jgi:hypothetical protein